MSLRYLGSAGAAISNIKLLRDAAPLPLADLLKTVQESFNRIFTRDDVAFTGFEMPNVSSRKTST